MRRGPFYESGELSRPFYGWVEAARKDASRPRTHGAYRNQQVSEYRRVRYLPRYPLPQQVEDISVDIIEPIDPAAEPLNDVRRH